MALRALIITLLQWLTLRAGAGADTRKWGGPSTADRAGQLIAAPQDGLEPEVGRSFMHWAVWVAIAIIFVLLAAGYVRRRLRARGDNPAWLTWRWRR